MYVGVHVRRASEVNNRRWPLDSPNIPDAILQEVVLREIGDAHAFDSTVALDELGCL